MGRIRTIKPEILTDAKAARLTDMAWRLWVCTWLLADDEGRFPADATILAGQVFPGRDSVSVHGALAEVSNAGFVRLYEVNGEVFGEIGNWKRHQKINRPSGPKFPAPCGEFIEPSLSPHGGLDADRDRDRDHDLSLPHPPKAHEGSRRFDWEEAYRPYPKKVGKAAGLKKAKAKIKTQEEFARFKAAIEKMAVLWRGQDTTYCPQFDTFVSKERWRDEQLPRPSDGGATTSSTPTKRAYTVEEMEAICVREEP